MYTRKLAVLVSLVAGAAASPAHAAVARVDRDFVAKVSQGGAFEVKASQLAVDKATAADVKSFAQTDVDEHTKVNDELKSIAAAQSLPIEPKLNAMLQKKLDHLSKLDGAAFDKAYVGEMKAIHDKDEGIFATEAKKAVDPDWKAFATKTDAIVKRHIDALGAMK